MKAALFKAPRHPLAIEDMPVPDPAPGEMLMKVARCGICGTDLHATEGDCPTARPNSRLGHEYAGEIVALGRKVTGFRVGDRITAMPVSGCGHCPACRTGMYIFCDDRNYHRGGFGQFLLTRPELALKLPATVSMAEGALVEPLAVGRHALRLLANGLPKRVLVLGAGPVGLAMVAWLKRAGCPKVAVVARSARRQTVAMALGADAFVLDGPEVKGELREVLGGAPDVVAECIGLPGAIPAAIDHVAVRGTVLALGFCTHPDSFIPAAALAKGITVHFSIAYDLTDFEACVDAFDAGWPSPAALVTRTIALADLPVWFEALRDGAAETKIMVDPWLQNVML